MVNASFFKVDYALAMVARASLLIAKSSGSVGWSCPETARCLIVRVLLAPYSATSRELSGAAKASLRLGLGHPL